MPPTTLILLDGTLFGNVDLGDPIAKCVIHFADGTMVERSIVLGQDVLDTNAEPPPLDDGHPVVGLVLRAKAAGPNDKPTRLYITTWDNPHPETEIVSLDFISCPTSSAAPFLVAITLDDK